MDEQKISSLVDTGNFWFPEGINTLARNIDSLYYFILYISILIFVGIFAFGLYYIVKYKRSKNNPVATSQLGHHYTIEILWTVIPLILVLIVFYWGFSDYLKLRVSESNAERIYVIGRKWNWQFDYPNQGIKKLGELVVPVNKPIELIMTSEDVLHSFYIPNLRIKRDVIPNRYRRIYINADKIGNYHVFCTEYCGDAHSKMLAVLRVVSQDDYDSWLATGGGADTDTPLDVLGAKLYKSKGCNGCHSLDGSNMVGPTWKDLYNKNRLLTDGSNVKADEDYLRNSIIYPNRQIVSGYVAGVMPSYAGLLSEREINAIIEYIKTLR